MKKKSVSLLQVIKAINSLEAFTSFLSLFNKSSPYLEPLQAKFPISFLKQAKKLKKYCEEIIYIYYKDMVKLIEEAQKAKLIESGWIYEFEKAIQARSIEDLTYIHRYLEKKIVL